VALPPASPPHKLRILFVGAPGDACTLARVALAREGIVVTVALQDILHASGAEAAQLMLIDLDAVSTERWRVAAEIALLAAPGAAIIGLATLTATSASCAAEFLRASSMDLIFIDRDPVADLVRAHALDATRRGACADALRALRRALPANVAPLYTALVHHAVDISNRDDLARHAGMARTRLTELARVYAGMSLGELDRWIRLTLAAALIERRAFTVVHVARLIGFGDVRSLRSAAYDLLGVTPTTFSATGACLLCARALAEFVHSATTKT
jgi:AraC-like DNA-binding protein